MKRLLATIKAPCERAEAICQELQQLGVARVEVRSVPYGEFMEESRLNYDFVFPEMISEEKEVCYIDFSFDATKQGRQEAFEIEYSLMQIPLNLRYEF